MAAKDDFDWKAILEGAECFHFTGITLALNDNVAGICRYGIITTNGKSLYFQGV